MLVSFIFFVSLQVGCECEHRGDDPVPTGETNNVYDTDTGDNDNHHDEPATNNTPSPGGGSNNGGGNVTPPPVTEPEVTISNTSSFPVAVTLGSSSRTLAKGASTSKSYTGSITWSYDTQVGFIASYTFSDGKNYQVTLSDSTIVTGKVTHAW